MKLVFSEQRTYEGYTYEAGEHEVHNVLASLLLATFPAVAKEHKKPTPKKAATTAKKSTASKGSSKK